VFFTSVAWRTLNPFQAKRMGPFGPFDALTGIGAKYAHRVRVGMTPGTGACDWPPELDTAAF